jgi:glycosyltransferase involved in cell wall biosynthesis
MRVAVVVDSLKIGGAQKMVATFASSAAIQRIDATVISLSDQNTKAIVDLIESAGVRIAQFPATSLKELGRLKRLTDFLTTEKFDIVHTHLSYANILGSVAGFLSGTPVVATLHSTGYDPDQHSGLFQTVENLCLRYLVTRIVVVGYSVMEVHADRTGHRRLDLIPNAVPTEKPIPGKIRQKIRREIVGATARRVIITVGRFVQAKGYEDMIDAFLILRGKHPETALLMVGSGMLFPEIQMKVRELHLTDSVFLLGARNDISQLLAASDLFASSSIREGLPVAVLEAMMAGLPIVGTDVGDMAMVVTDEVGRIVAPHHPELLAEALDELLDSPDKICSMGKAARLRAIKDYSVEAWIGKHAELYKEVLKSKRRNNSK